MTRRKLGSRSQRLGTIKAQAMGIGWSNRKPNPIAIDFGSETVRLLQLSEEARPSVVGSASIRVPMADRCDPVSYFNFVGQHLKPAMRGVGFKGRRAVASISSFLTYVQHIRIGACPPEQLEEAIKLELSGRLPLDPETMVVRHVSVGEIFADGQQKQEIICLAASRESVFGCVELAKTAGLDIVGMHGEPMATLEAFKHLFRRDDDREQATLFIDLGATTTNAAISHGPRLVFAKTVTVGVMSLEYEENKDAPVPNIKKCFEMAAEAAKRIRGKKNA